MTKVLTTQPKTELWKWHSIPKDDIDPAWNYFPQGLRCRVNVKKKKATTRGGIINIIMINGMFIGRSEIRLKFAKYVEMYKKYSIVFKRFSAREY